MTAQWQPWEDGEISLVKNGLRRKLSCTLGVDRSDCCSAKDALPEWMKEGSHFGEHGLSSHMVPLLYEALASGVASLSIVHRDFPSADSFIHDQQAECFGVTKAIANHLVQRTLLFSAHQGRR